MNSTIDTCQDNNCPLKDTCFRVGPEKRENQVIQFEYDGGCNHHWEMKHEPGKQLNKI